MTKKIVYSSLFAFLFAIPNFSISSEVKDRRYSNENAYFFENQAFLAQNLYDELHRQGGTCLCHLFAVIEAYAKAIEIYLVMFDHDKKPGLLEKAFSIYDLLKVAAEKLDEKKILDQKTKDQLDKLDKKLQSLKKFERPIEYID